MNKSIFLLPILFLAAGCDNDAAPTGQVVAVVDGQEITISEVDAELNGARSADPAQQRRLQQAALQNIVNRILLAKAADDRGVTDGPAAAIVERRTEQLAKIELLERQLRSAVPAVSREEIETFVTDNPSLFAARKIFLVEQYIVPNPPAGLQQALAPLDTMEQVQAELTRRNLTARRTVGVIDALTLQPEAVRQIVALPAGTVFVLPDAGGVRINRIRETQIQPITGTDATNVAGEMLRAARSNQQLSNTVQEIVRDGQASVRYNDAFRPRPASGSPAAKGPAPAEK